MRYIMTEKLFSFGDDFYIKNEHGEDLFFVDGKVFSVGNKLSFQDLQGNELVSIRQKLLSLGNTYELYKGDELYAVIKKPLFTFFRYKFSIDVPGPDDLEAVGNFLQHEYIFSRGDREVARVSKSWFSLRNNYGVEIAPGEDDLLILATAVVIDQVCHDKDDD
jgi:uncharacterized protein YxjI